MTRVAVNRFRPKHLAAILASILAASTAMAAPAKPADLTTPESVLLTLDNGTVKVGIDRSRGAAITWLSWSAHPENAVNHSDPGRLIQQSYYAGKRLNRMEDGQSKSWSPWSWNPIQGGGVSSWARVNAFQRIGQATLFSETVPKLWDMPDEEAAALMRQWTSFEPGMPNVVTVRCEFISKRSNTDRWGPALLSPQEVPACYFTRQFGTVKTYLGDGKWRAEQQPPGPPWGRSETPRKAMALLNGDGQGVAVFSPAGNERWNFGPHSTGDNSDSAAAPCMHVAPIARVKLGPKSELRFRYWLVVGTEAQLAARLDALWEKYSNERLELTETSKPASSEASTAPATGAVP